MAVRLLYHCHTENKHYDFGKSDKKGMLLAQYKIIVCTRALMGNLRLGSVTPNMNRF